METAPKTRFFRTEDVERKWYLVDVNGKTLGRVASQIAHIIRGKHKPTFTPQDDVGDFVVVVNAEKVLISGKRVELKEYYHNTQYPGGARFESFKNLIQRRPEAVIEHAVKGMLPHNRLGRKLIRKLKVYTGSTHPHDAQQPEAIIL
ncbi:MAG: 50S ribosomal protein L13 [bacterium]